MNRCYCAEAPRIGLGFQRPIQDARPFLDACFKEIPSHVEVHGWAMTGYLDYPFASVDSTTWLWELRAIMGARGQGVWGALRTLTTGELIEIIQKKYLRAARRARWDGELVAFDAEEAAQEPLTCPFCPDNEVLGSLDACQSFFSAAVTRWQAEHSRLGRRLTPEELVACVEAVHAAHPGRAA